MSEALRIAVVAACPFPLPRGTPVRILRLAEALVERGHEVHVFTYHLGTGDIAPGLQVHRIADVPSYTKLSPGPTYAKLARVDPPLARLSRKLLREKPFDVIHAHHYEGVLVAAFARRGLNVPLVYDAHTLLMNELPSYPLGLPVFFKRGVGKTLDRILPELADHTVCVTQSIRDDLVGKLGMSDDDVTVMANGVEYEHFDPAPYAKVAKRPGKTVVFTGNLAGYQGINYLLEAFAHVPRQVPDARLLIASDSSFEPYEALARKLGIREAIDVETSPPFAGLPQLLAGADVAVNPRVVCDGLPVKLLNYMAAARAVVSFDSSAPGVVHGSTGWLAPAGDTAAFGAGIVELLNDPGKAQQLGVAARQFIAENSRWPVVARRCEELYRRLIANRN